MAIAFLVLGNSCPRVFAEMARLLDRHPDFCLYLHLDSRVDSEAYLKPAAALLDRVNLVTPRYPVFWGGFNMIKATEALAKSALRDVNNQIFCLLSDDSLPLYPPPILKNLLRNLPNRIDLSLASRNPIFHRRYTEYYCFDSAATTPRYQAIESRSISHELSSSIMRLEGLRGKGKYPFSAIWSGSQWWSFDRFNLQSVLDSLSSDQWIRESFEFSAVPDEMTFHTLYARSSHFEIRSHTGPMQADFTKEPSPFVYSSIEQLFPVRTDKLFFRKVSDQCASLIICQLHQWWNARAL